MAYRPNNPVRSSRKLIPKPPYQHPRSVNVSQSERLLSTALGAVLAVTALDRSAWSRAALLGLSGAMLYRGLSGHCHLYKRLGLDTAATPDSSQWRSTSR